MARKKSTGAPKQREAEASPLLRATYHLPPGLIDKLRDVAWWDRLTVNELVRAALEAHVDRLERDRGEPYPRRQGTLRRGKPLA